MGPAPAGFFIARPLWLVRQREASVLSKNLVLGERCAGVGAQNAQMCEFCSVCMFTFVRLQDEFCDLSSERQTSFMAARPTSLASRSLWSTLAISILLPCAHALSSTAWLNTGNRQLGLLPCTLDDTLQPGEKRDVFVFEDRHCACIANAAATNGCLGMLYLTEEEGEPTEFSSLLEIESFKADQLGTWARLKCVGRCLLKDVGRSMEGYYTARVELYADTGADASDEAIASVRKLHATTAAQRKELYTILASYDFDEPAVSEYIHVSPYRSDAPFGIFEGADDDDALDDDEEEVEDYVFVGLDFERPTTFGTTYFSCRDHGELDDDESGADIDELVATRRAVLTASHDSDGEQELLDAVRDVWLVESAAAAERQLISLAAIASLGPPERAEGLLMRSSSERLEFAAEALAAQRSHLASLLRMAKSEALG